ncbi:hypothetical protein [Halovenus marina]|uniref:hypothetical protein n=1 Tax=Halovenus marina TaxID=3396621 RepID=UPI003F562C54
MEWRCEWCGKPHGTDDPPCDNCGHGSFEKAVVRQTDLGTEGHESTKMWVCTECGREHPKHTPPCSRCGAMSLERREVRVDDRELSTGGYLEYLGQKQLLALGVAAALALVLALGVFGVIDLPGLGDSGVPTVSNVPGNASTTGDVSLSAVESSYLATLNDRRTGAESQPLDRVPGIDAVATYYNQRWVKAEYGDGSVSTEDISGLLADRCDRTPTLNAFRVERLGSDPGRTLAESRLAQSPRLASLTASRTGIDTHVAPNGRVFVTQILC